MRQAARVSSINTLREFRHALIEFGDIDRSALGESESKIQRAVWFVEHDQPAYWQQQRRRRANELAQAQTELFRAQVASADQQVSATLERRAVLKAKQRLDEAQTKLDNLKRWRPILEREALLYRAQCQQLASSVDADLPKALATLDKMIQSLERYVKLAPPRPATEEAAEPAPAPG